MRNREIRCIVVDGAAEISLAGADIQAVGATAG